MTRGDLELFVRRLFGDEAFRGAALLNPELAMSGYRLSRTEKVAARQLCSRLVTPEGLNLAGPHAFWF
jgi:hypothetical protein